MMMASHPMAELCLMCLYGLLCYSSAVVLVFLLILHKVHSGMVLKAWSKCYVNSWTSASLNAFQEQFSNLLSSGEMGREERELLWARIVSSVFTWINSSLLKRGHFLAWCYWRVWMFLKGWAAPEVPLDRMKYWIAFTTLWDCVWYPAMCFTHNPEIDVEGFL